MCKMIVVIYRRADFTRAQCLTYLREVHGPMAERLPDLVAYRQNHVVDDPTRPDPGWDAIIELGWDRRDVMERAWQTPDGEAATADLAAFTDLARTSWSMVDEYVRR